jgi:hypothetical protein
MISKGTQMIVACIALAMLLAYGTSLLVGGTALPVTVLLVVGVILPTIVNERWIAGTTT